MNRRNFLSLSTAAALLPACGKGGKNPQAALRLGHFPNITHIQGLVAHQLSRLGKGWFEPRIGVPVEWFTFNAGPSATEAILGGGLDAAYLGPSPILNAYARSKGRGITIAAAADFRGRKIATPQLGNTQDVQLRALLTEAGLKITQAGGDATILPTQNADLLAMFQQGSLDAAWAPEPYASILELEAGATNWLKDTATNVTLLASSASLLRDRPELAARLAAAHHELTDWILANPEEARRLMVAELTALTTREPKAAVLDLAIPRVILSNEVSRQSLETMVAQAKAAGFLREFPPIEPLLPSLPPATP
jgi:NitT/TauT family transport system substrate-binding protein